MSVQLTSSGEQALVVGDAITQPLISFAHPEWRPGYDGDMDQAVATRRRLLDQAGDRPGPSARLSLSVPRRRPRGARRRCLPVGARALALGFLRAKPRSTDVRSTAASLIGRQGQALSGHPPLTVSMSLAGSRFSSDSAPRPFHHGIGRPCRQCDCRFKRPYELTSSIVPRATSFHRWADLRFSRI
jgi:hypothetical protein